VSRFRKSEYTTEKRNREKSFTQQQKTCEGNMGLCQSKKVTPCQGCARPFCAKDLASHQTRCLGMK